jgi:hypothetical protein
MIKEVGILCVLRNNGFLDQDINWFMNINECFMNINEFLSQVIECFMNFNDPGWEAVLEKIVVFYLQVTMQVFERAKLLLPRWAYAEERERQRQSQRGAERGTERLKE